MHSYRFCGPSRAWTSSFAAIGRVALVFLLGGASRPPCSVLATSSAQHASLQTQASLPLPSSSSCPASALHRHSLLVPMSSPSDMVLLQHVHPSSRANCHHSFEYGRHRQTFDSSRLSPIIDVLSTQIGAACLSPTASSTIISTATTSCHRFRFISHRLRFNYPRLWGVAVHHTSMRHHNKTQTASSPTIHFFLSYQFVTGSLASTQRPGYKALPRI